MSEVKRYTLWMVSESGCELEPYSEESPDGLYVHHADYAALEAECQRLRQAMLRLVTTHCAAAIKGQAADAELEQYLSAGIAQIEAERDKLRAELEQARELLKEARHFCQLAPSVLPHIDAWLERNA